MTTTTATTARVPIWWSNAIFFVGIHVSAIVGVLYLSPLAITSRKTIILTILLWQLSCFGITLGYHRLYSHRSFRAAIGVRILLTILGSMAFQGSIKWWCLRHRLHHRFTDDPIHDPYSATRGLLFSHVGWIFFKPSYPRMESIDKEDLEKDPVVNIQHKYYIPIALFSGLILPALIGWTWNDALGAFIWAGLIGRVATWHCTFLVNSLAHWEGFQKYSDETTARGNLIMAMLTCGEGDHNFHAFPHDFRAGPRRLDWDPSKWIINLLYVLNLVTRVRSAREEDIAYALDCMRRKQNSSSYQSPFINSKEEKIWEGPIWDREEVKRYIEEKMGRCCLIIDDLLLDVTAYMGEHPGGSALLRNYSLRNTGDDTVWQDATWAFQNMNYHSLTARRHLKELVIAKVKFLG